MYQWKKLGRVFLPQNDDPFLCSHASNPLPIHLHDDVFRIFYSGRNQDNRSSVGYFEIDLLTREILNYPKKPLITFGAEGSFTSHGISIGNQYHVEGNDYILFMAWQIPSNAHWRGDIGRLQLLDQQKMSLNPQTPYMGVDEEDPVSLSYPFVLFHEGIYKMWYGSTITWNEGNGEMIHVLKYATSKDAEQWEKHGIAIPYEVGVAQAFSRPTVVVDEDGYHMWYSFRSGLGTTYRIGYAHSEDGINWKRLQDQSGITISSSGWDSQMICYPYVFDHNGKRYMLYNGNSHGKSGIGLAVQVDA